MKTIPFQNASQYVWDVVIIGAGVAGASLAISTAKTGFKTLLIEAKAFPREKVCGGCLNQRAQASLERLGVLEPLVQQGAIWLNRFDLRIRQTSVNWPIPALLSVRRSTLDSLLVHSAIEAGACFLPETTAILCPEDPDYLGKDNVRRVAIRHGDQSNIVKALLVIASDGLTRSSLRDLPKMESHARIDSRIGVQALLEPSEVQFSPPKHTLQMLVSSQGYVGLSNTDGGKLDMAAAIDPKAIQEAGGISKMLERIMSQCLKTEVRLRDGLNWLSTPRLTRSSPCVSAYRMLSIGDSIGYVEPFTGEGMSWALSSAEAAFPLVASTIDSNWQDATSHTWSTWVHGQHARKQRHCRWLAYQLRRPRLAACVLRVCDVLSPIRTVLIRKAIS